MKLGMKRSLYNAEIRNRRVELGLTQGQLAREIGVSTASVSHAELLRTTKSAAPTVVKLAEFFNTTPEDLCPGWLEMIEGLPKKADSQVDVTAPMLESISGRTLLLESSNTHDLQVNKVDLKRQIGRALQVLPYRQQQVLTMKLGLNDKPVLTEREIAGELGVSSTRVHQLAATGLNRLRRSPLAMRMLMDFKPEHVIDEPKNVEAK